MTGLEIMICVIWSKQLEHSGGSLFSDFSGVSVINVKIYNIMIMYSTVAILLHAFSSHHNA